MALSVKYNLVDAASPMLADIAALGPGKAAKVIAPAMRDLFRNRFFQLNTERPNRLGGKRQNFWNQVARGSAADPEPRGTEASTDDQGVIVSINHVGIRQRIEGGVIKPTGGRKFLSIPAITEAYGTVPADWGFKPKSGGTQDSRTGRLHFVPTRNGGALVMNSLSEVTFGKRVKKDGSRTVIKGGSLGGQVVFWLVKSVTQKPDPTILPTQAQVTAAASYALSEWIGTQAKRAAAPRSALPAPRS